MTQDHALCWALVLTRVEPSVSSNSQSVSQSVSQSKKWVSSNSQSVSQRSACVRCVAIVFPFTLCAQRNLMALSFSISKFINFSCTLHQIFCHKSLEGFERLGMWHEWKLWEIVTRFCKENPKGRDHLGELRTDWRIILKWIIRKKYEGADWILVAQDRTTGENL